MSVHEKDFQPDAQWKCVSDVQREKVVHSNVGFLFGQCIPSKESLLARNTCRTGGSKFDRCVEKDFHECLDSIVARGMVDSYRIDRFGREDYICQSLPYQLKGFDTEKGKTIADAGVGFCTPTYFVFQLRLDGHPIP